MADVRSINISTYEYCVLMQQVIVALICGVTPLFFVVCISYLPQIFCSNVYFCEDK